LLSKTCVWNGIAEGALCKDHSQRECILPECRPVESVSIWRLCCGWPNRFQTLRRDKQLIICDLWWQDRFCPLDVYLQASPGDPRADDVATVPPFCLSVLRRVLGSEGGS